MLKSLILILFTIIAIIYSLRFGYLLTNYPHGGQFAGVPFAAFMLTLTGVYFLAKKHKLKSALFVASFSYFIALVGFSITIEQIRAGMENYLEVLYSGSMGGVNTILIIWLVLSIITTVISIVTNRSKKSEASKDNL